MSKAVAAHLRSNLIGYVALFVALSGTAWAANALPRNSVATEQIRNRQVKSIDVGKSQIRSPHIARQTIRNSDIARLKRLTLADDATIAFGGPGAALSGSGPNRVEAAGDLLAEGTISSGFGGAGGTLSPDGTMELHGESASARLTLAGPVAPSGEPFRSATIYLRVNDAGKTEVVADFSGAATPVVIATEP